jgi:iron complex transport system ATP-binding protein
VNEHAIRIESVSVSLDHTPILSDVSLAVESGAWVTIIGPNGAGKSTLLKAIGGGHRFTGAISVFGTAAGLLKRRERARLVATVPQNPVVPPGVTVRR